MSDWNLWQSIDSALRLQRILFVSPFYLSQSTEKLTSCWRIKAYSVFGTLITLAVIGFSVTHLNYMEMVFSIAPNEMIWRMLCYYIIISTCCHFIVNMLITGIELQQQIQFLENIHEIDQQIQIKFGANVNHREYKRNVLIALRIFYFYCTIEGILGVAFVFVAGHGNPVSIPPVFAYLLQDITLTIQACASANYLFLIQRRFQLLNSVHHELHSDYIKYMKIGIRNNSIEDTFLNKLLEMFELFKDTTKLVTLFDETRGWISANQIVKTFMQTLVQMYFIFLTVNHQSGEHAVVISCGFFFMFCGEIIKAFLNVIGVHSVYAAVVQHLNEKISMRIFLIDFFLFPDRQLQTQLSIF